MAITKKLLQIEVNMGNEDIVTAVQGDSASRFLDVYLTDGGVPVDLNGCTV